MYTYKFKPTLKEFYLALYFMFVPVFIKRLIIFGVFAAIGLVIAYSFNEWWFSHYFIFWLTVIYLISVALDPVINIMRRKNLNPEAFELETNVVINDDGLTLLVDETKNDILWNHFTTLAETSQFIFIYRTRVSAFFIPKRVFTGSAEQQQVIDFIRGKLPEQTKS